MARFGRRIPIQHQFNPTIAPFEPVAVDVVGPGSGLGFVISTSNNPTQQQYIYGNLLFVFVSVYTQGPTGGNPCTITVGGKTMQNVASVLNYINIANQAQSSFLFQLWNPPQGLQTISFSAYTGYNSNALMNAVSFRNVGSLGQMQTASSSGSTTSISQTVTGLKSNGLIFNAMTYYSSGYSGKIASTQQNLLGTSTSSAISATASGTSWSSVSVPLNPLPFPPALPELYNQVPVTMSRGAYL